MEPEIFLDPEYTLTHPDESRARLALNENGELGFVCSYQDVGGEIIFTGIGLATNKVWISKTPLVVKEDLDPAALENIARVTRTISHSNPPPLGETTDSDIHSLPDNVFNLGSLSAIFKMLEQMQSGQPPTPPAGDHNYFGQPDFNSDDTEETNVSFEFNMDSFLNAFDAGEDDDELDFGNEDDDYLSDEH
tara:strand:+ start:1220 stop:1792 length:573 start_codon:yes stop_codon:yes gene_type:complete